MKVGEQSPSNAFSEPYVSPFYKASVICVCRCRNWGPETSGNLHKVTWLVRGELRQLWMFSLLLLHIGVSMLFLHHPFYSKIVTSLRLTRIICRAVFLCVLLRKNWDMSFPGQWNLQPVMQHSFFSIQCAFILVLKTHFLQGLSNEILQIFQKIYYVSDSLFTLLT